MAFADIFLLSACSSRRWCCSSRWSPSRRVRRARPAAGTEPGSAARPRLRLVVGVAETEHGEIGARRPHELQADRQPCGTEAGGHRQHRRAGHAGRAPPPPSSGDRCPSPGPPTSAGQRPGLEGKDLRGRQHEDVAALVQRQHRAIPGDRSREAGTPRAPGAPRPRSISQTASGFIRRGWRVAA